MVLTGKLTSKANGVEGHPGAQLDVHHHVDIGRFAVGMGVWGQGRCSGQCMGERDVRWHAGEKNRHGKYDVCSLGCDDGVILNVHLALHVIPSPHLEWKTCLFFFSRSTKKLLSLSLLLQYVLCPLHIIPLLHPREGTFCLSLFFCD